MFFFVSSLLSLLQLKLLLLSFIVECGINECERALLGHFPILRCVLIRAWIYTIKLPFRYHFSLAWNSNFEDNSPWHFSYFRSISRLVLSFSHTDPCLPAVAHGQCILKYECHSVVDIFFLLMCQQSRLFEMNHGHHHFDGMLDNNNINWLLKGYPGQWRWWWYW